MADRYRIERELGRGGMAVVYLAHDVQHDRRVAIKFIGDELGSAVGTQRFLQEIKLTAALQHPHVLPVYDSGVTPDNVLYYVMPWVEGGSLRNRLEQGPLPIAEAVKVARDVGDALAFAHQRGIVHRDIKPENILFSDGHALVADFGIARMVTTTNAQQQFTAVGVVVGTPAYMSPEQGFGSVVDHRSDIYSLACVVYEMLTGRVPFSSPAAGQWSEFGLSRMPPSIRAERAEVPEALEAELIRALAPSPQDRPQSAREFADAIQGAAGTSASPYVARSGGPRTRTRRAWRAGVIAGATIAVVLTLGVAMFPPAHDQLVTLGVIDVQPSLVLAAPVQSGDSTLATRAQAADRALRQELARWSGLSVASVNATRDAIGGTPSQESALRGARQLRAGLMLWSRVGTEGNGTVIETQLFDSPTGISRGVFAAPASDDSTLPQWAQRAAATLLAGGEASPAVARSLGATHSYPAWRAYTQGHRALDAWQLAAADTAFRAAIAADARFAAARAWLAQVMVWSRRGSRTEYRRHADEALLLAASLPPEELRMARALAAIGRREEPRACAEYRALLAADSTNVTAWLGLGDCGALDELVVPDRRSPSGYAFRGNLPAAVQAYDRAVRLSAGAHAALPFTFIERLLFTRSDRYRRGLLVSDTTRVFGAQPAPAGDSVTYVPWPIVRNALPDDPVGFEEALHRNRVRTLQYATAWAARVPNSMDAFEALASVQEERGEITGPGAAGRPSAMNALDSALRLATDDETRARLVATRVRLLVKAGDFEGARATVDSLIGRRAPVTMEEAHWWAGLASLTGRSRDAARLARLGNAPPVAGWDTLPGAVGSAATLLLIQSALGVCTPEFRNSFAAVEAVLDGYAVPVQRESARAALTVRARRLAVPCLGAEQVARFPANTAWDRMQARLAAADMGAVRQGFDSLVFSRRYRRPGAVALDFTFMESWLVAAAGDSATAMRHLDHTLSALPTLNRNAVWELAQSAAIGRALVWRADLASRAGDLQNSRRWAAAAAALWKHADPELQADLARMRSLASR